MYCIIYWYTMPSKQHNATRKSQSKLLITIRCNLLKEQARVLNDRQSSQTGRVIVFFRDGMCIKDSSSLDTRQTHIFKTTPAL